MAKTKQKPNELFEQTIKTVSIAKNIEDEADKAMSYNDQLRMLEDHMQNAKSREEYEAFEEQISNIKKDMKFKSRLLELTDEQRELFTNNHQIEQSKANELYHELAQKASTILDEAVTKITPILRDMQTIENKSYNAHFIRYVLSDSIPANPPVDRRERHFKSLRKFPNNTKGYNGKMKTIESRLNELNKSLKKEVR